MGKRKMLKKLVLIWIGAMVIFQLGRQVFQQEEWQVRNYIHDQVKTAFPDANKKVQESYGLFHYGKARNKADTALESKPVVILIHGLDEPGRIWMNLAPVLDEKGYSVMYMSYPNDQSVAASARFFYQSLKKRVPPGQGKGDPVVIIGHSMGGLVSRQMLTDPEINFAQESETGKVPRVSKLILVGTPNHGSELARFRFFMEIRDQAQNLFEKDTHWLQGLLDGAGAAGIDLIPGSEFLTRLNSRPYPSNVNIHVVAGVISPWNREEIHQIIQDLAAVMPGQNQDDVKGFEKALNSIGNTVGDGLVTLDSARLVNVPLTRVQGSHLTMIRNLTRDSKRVPPAIPVILGILDPKGSRNN